ncbi:MAG: hypothetical protein QGH07_12045 [Alphaproteobacteria bacterium]|nr:hypothetical protein [Alphaproteobacteria bacterium]
MPFYAEWNAFEDAANLIQCHGADRFCEFVERPFDREAFAVHRLDMLCDHVDHQDI